MTAPAEVFVAIASGYTPTLHASLRSACDALLAAAPVQHKDGVRRVLAAALDGAPIEQRTNTDIDAVCGKRTGGYEMIVDWWLTTAVPAPERKIEVTVHAFAIHRYPVTP